MNDNTLTSSIPHQNYQKNGRYLRLHSAKIRMPIQESHRRNSFLVKSLYNNQLAVKYLQQAGHFTKKMNIDLEQAKVRPNSAKSKIEINQFNNQEIFKTFNQN